MHLVGLRVMAADSETVGHTVSAVGGADRSGRWRIFFFFLVGRGP